MPLRLLRAWEHKGAVPAVVAGVRAWEQLCSSRAVPQHDTRCPGLCAVPVMPECHQLFSAVLARGTAGEQAVAAETAMLVATSPRGKWGRSCQGGWGCAGGSVLRARLSPGDLLLLHIRLDSAPMGDGSPTGCADRRIRPFPAFSPSFQDSVSGWVGKVSRGDQLNVYPPLQHGNAASALVFMPGDTLQLPAASPLPAHPPPPLQPCPRPLPALALGMAPLRVTREGTSLLFSYRPARFGARHPLPCSRGDGGQEHRARSGAEMLHGAERAMGWVCA